VKPETFSRVIKNLSDNAVIEVHGSHFTILDRKGLEEIADLANTQELVALPCNPGGVRGP
jgi:hypothetical protein